MSEFGNYLQDPVFFNNLYKYAYNFAKIDNQKYIDLEVAIGIKIFILHKLLYKDLIITVLINKIIILY